MAIAKVAKSLQKTRSIKDSEISNSKADMNEKHTAFGMIFYFFINHNIFRFQLIFDAFFHQRRSAHTSRIPPKPEGVDDKVNLFSYFF